VQADFEILTRVNPMISDDAPDAPWRAPSAERRATPLGARGTLVGVKLEGPFDSRKASHG
jgi:hypothetical protein